MKPPGGADETDASMCRPPPWRLHVAAVARSPRRRCTSIAAPMFLWRRKAPLCLLRSLRRRRRQRLFHILSTVDPRELPRLLLARQIHRRERDRPDLVQLTQERPPGGLLLRRVRLDQDQPLVAPGVHLLLRAENRLLNCLAVGAPV